MTKVGWFLLAGYLALTAFAGCRSAHTTSAILYIEEQQYEKAIQVIHEGFQYRDDEPDAYYWLGEAHSKVAEEAVRNNAYVEAKENYELSYQYYKRARDIDPENFIERTDVSMQHNYTMRLRQGVEDFRSGYYEQAEGHFRLAYSALPDSLRPIKDIARMKMKQANEVSDPVPLFEEALALLDQVLDVNPDAYALLADKANVLVQLGRLTEADQIYQELLKDHGDDVGLLIDIANLARDQKEFERTAELYMRIVDLYAQDNDVSNDGENTRVLLVGAAEMLAYEDIRRYDEALELLDRALALEPFPSQATLAQRLQTHYNHGTWLKNQAETEDNPILGNQIREKGLEQFRTGVNVGNALVEQYPSYSLGYYYLALCQLELGDTAAGEQNLKKFRELEGME
jgi:tetratricopeptide (TPR) repeat protein